MKKRFITLTLLIIGFSASSYAGCPPETTVCEGMPDLCCPVIIHFNTPGGEKEQIRVLDGSAWYGEGNTSREAILDSLENGDACLSPFDSAKKEYLEEQLIRCATEEKYTCDFPGYQVCGSGCCPH